MNNIQKNTLVFVAKRNKLPADVLLDLVEYSENYTYKNVSPAQRRKFYDKIITIYSNKEEEDS